MEVWKDVVGYEGLYEVSNTGKVRSLNYRMSGKTKELSQRKNNYGYLTVLLSINGSCKKKTVHRIVADAFVVRTGSYDEVNHIDEDKENNNAENLEWCTHRQNVEAYTAKHKSRDGKNKSKRVIQKTISGNIVKVWPNSRAIHLETGMSDWSISECCRGKRNKAYGYIWQYAN